MEWLFNTADFATRNHCGRWEYWVIILNQLANFLIFIAYFSIPLSLYLLWSRLRTNPVVRAEVRDNSWILVMFFVFIFSCGLTHLMDVLAFSWAPYRFFTLVDLVCAATSIPTALLLPGVIGRVLRT